MLTQCKKIGRWVEWSGMQLSVEKCTITAAYCRSIKEGISNPAQYDKYLNQTTQKLQPIKLFGQQLKQVPPTAPFKFLGVYMQLKNTPSFRPTTPALIPETFTTQAQATTTKVEQKARALLNSQLTPNQKLIVETQSVLGGIKHTMATKPFTAKVSTTTVTPCSRLRAIALKPYLQALFLIFFHIPSISTYSAACPVVSRKQIARFQGTSDHIHTFMS
jgi:hypothetical protein